MDPELELPKKHNKRKTFLIGLLVVVILSGAAYIGVHEQRNFEDYLALRGYSAPQSIASLATQDTFTALTRRVFYVNHPQLDSKAVFAAECPNSSSSSVVLGCYHNNQGGIFILAVTDPDLYGIEQVTAAHEVLHATYDRLSSSKRAQVNSWLLNYYHNDLTNPNIEAEIKIYQQTEPTAWINELNSVFGTEVSYLPKNLANYYATYFSNRLKIVAYYNQYQAAFLTRENEINSDDTTLTQINTTIDTNNEELTVMKSKIDADQATLNAQKVAGEISLYNQNVPLFNQEVDIYNNLVDSTTSLISQYNSLVATRNAIALEEQDLVKDITSSNQTISN